MMSQRSMVAASLMLAPTRAERHGTYSSRPRAPRTADGTDPARERTVEGPVSHDARPEESGAVTHGAGRPTPCSRCDGSGTYVDANGARWKCGRCGGTGVEPTEPPRARVIPGTPRST